MLPKRLRRLPSHEIGDGLTILEARRPLARLLGLALLREPPAGYGLLIPRCSAVHTFGMRFPLDLLFLDEDGGVVRFDRAVPRRRLRRCRGSSSVIELPALR